MPLIELGTDLSGLAAGATIMFSCQVIVGAITTVNSTPTGSLANLLIAACFICESLFENCSAASVLTSLLTRAGIAAFGASWGTLPWITSSEISSQQLREKSLGLGAWSGFGVGLISNFVTPYIQNPEYGGLGAK